MVLTSINIAYIQGTHLPELEKNGEMTSIYPKPTHTQIRPISFHPYHVDGCAMCEGEEIGLGR
jgi:hypothetical protein